MLEQQRKDLLHKMRNRNFVIEDVHAPALYVYQGLVSYHKPLSNYEYQRYLNNHEKAWAFADMSISEDREKWIKLETYIEKLTPEQFEVLEKEIYKKLDQ